MRDSRPTSTLTTQGLVIRCQPSIDNRKNGCLEFDNAITRPDATDAVEYSEDIYAPAMNRRKAVFATTSGRTAVFKKKINAYFRKHFGLLPSAHDN